ncbi:hypothetical protein CRYUN_Cryun18bG0038000 [Craigia yunnanensis]
MLFSFSSKYSYLKWVLPHNSKALSDKELELERYTYVEGFTLLMPSAWIKSLRSRSRGKGITDADIINWANWKVKSIGRTPQIESFKDKSLCTGLFFLELLSDVEPRAINWNLVTKGESDEEKRLNATYIISVACKLGCSIFLLPEDIMEGRNLRIVHLASLLRSYEVCNEAGLKVVCRSILDLRSWFHNAEVPSCEVCNEAGLKVVFNACLVILV